MDFNHLILKKYNHWSLYLNENQCYLGRVYIWANREDASDFIETTEGERKEFFKIAEVVRSALDKLFKPDLINYAALGNICPHLHVHIIPRYKQMRTFHGVKFLDERWGKNYAPYNKEHNIENDVLNNIKEELIKSIS